MYSLLPFVASFSGFQIATKKKETNVPPNLSRLYESIVELKHSRHRIGSEAVACAGERDSTVLHSRLAFSTCERFIPSPSFSLYVDPSLVISP